MRCDHCGCDIPEGEEIEDTRATGFSGTIGNTVQTTELFYLCRSCAASANQHWKILGYVFVGIAILGLLLCLWDWLSGRRML